MGRRRLFWVALSACFWPIGETELSAASEGTYRFLIPTVTAYPGDRVRVTVQGEHDQPAQGFSFALQYPSELLAIEEIHVVDTILEAIGADTIEKLVLPEQGVIAIGVLVDAEPPFSDARIPSLGFPLDFVHFEVSVSAAAERDIILRFGDELLRPPVKNLYVVDSQSIPVTELGEGRIRILGSRKLAGFIRGDVNMDGGLDISDPAALLDYVFLGGPAPRCREAADSNRDARIDISDAVYVLNYLFAGGPPPPPPNAPSEEYESGLLDCKYRLRVL